MTHRTTCSLVVLIALTACKDEPVPTWDDATIDQTLFREHFGEGFALATADLDGDGDDEVLYGGRGLAALDATSLDTHHPRWHTPFPKESTKSRDGDNEWVQALATPHIDDDATPDILMLDSHDRAIAVDGSSGEVLWSRTLETTFSPVRMALLHVDGDGVLDFVPSGGTSAYSGATGATLWTVEQPFPP